MKKILPIVLGVILLVGCATLFFTKAPNNVENEASDIEEFADNEDGYSGDDGIDIDEFSDIDEEALDKIDNGIYYDEEAEGAKISFKKANAEDFYGSWHSESGQSAYYYGNLDLDIKSSGVWTGNVGGENLAGTWDFSSNSLLIRNDLVSYKLTFAKNNKLILQEYREGSDEPINVVLVRK